MNASSRITLGTYSKAGLFNSFGEGAYGRLSTRAALEAALADVKRCKLTADGYHHPDELGWCVAVFTRAATAPARILARVPFAYNAR